MMLFLGLVLGICVWVLVGAVIPNNQAAGRYQVSTFSAAADTPTDTRGWWGYVIIDTKTGDVVDQKVNHKGYK